MKIASFLKEFASRDQIENGLIMLRQTEK